MDKIKVCPEGSILNLETNRCNKIKANKAKKICPEGSILNIETNRCNKIKCGSKLDEAKKEIKELKKQIKELQIKPNVKPAMIKDKTKPSIDTMLKNYKGKFGNNMDNLKKAIETYRAKKNLIK